MNGKWKEEKELRGQCQADSPRVSKVNELQMRGFAAKEDGEEHPQNDAGKEKHD
jgi:hypothetical protein